jgi:hypothetical protein
MLQIGSPTEQSYPENQCSCCRPHPACGPMRRRVRCARLSMARVSVFRRYACVFQGLTLALRPSLQAFVIHLITPLIDTLRGIRGCPRARPDRTRRLRCPRRCNGSNEPSSTTLLHRAYSLPSNEYIAPRGEPDLASRPASCPRPPLKGWLKLTPDATRLLWGVGGRDGISCGLLRGRLLIN